MSGSGNPWYDATIMTLLEALQTITEGRTEEGRQGLLSLIGTPEEALARFNLGLLYKGDDRLLEALDEYEKAAALAPEQAEIWNEIGLIHDAMGRIRLAEENYRKALDLNPELAAAWNNWGVCAFLKEDFGAARQRFEKAVEAEPEMESAWYNLRDTCRELGDEASALQADEAYRKLSRD